MPAAPAPGFPRTEAEFIDLLNGLFGAIDDQSLYWLATADPTTRARNTAFNDGVAAAARAAALYLRGRGIPVTEVPADEG